MTDSNEIKAAEQTAMPLFYKRPRPIELSRHAKAGLGPRQHFGFARGTNAVALTLPEFAAAVRSYPIVFSSEQPVLPFAVVGLKEGENLFVDDRGSWRENDYVPAYVRRYPFIFSEVPNSKQLVLCIDESAGNFHLESAQPFFIDGKPGPLLQRMLGFGEAYQAHYEDTRRFGEWLDGNGMLEDKLARVQVSESEMLTLRGFKLLNAQKLRTLDDSQVLELYRKGWMPMLHFHLLSLENLPALSRLMRERRMQSQDGVPPIDPARRDSIKACLRHAEAYPSSGT